MKKMILVIVIPIIVIIASVSAIIIKNKVYNENSNNVVQNEISSENTEKVMREIEETEELKELPQKLQDIGIETNKNTEFKFERTGAICGYVLQSVKDKTASITILQYNKKSEEYKTAEKEQKVTIKNENGTEISSFKAKVKNGFAYKVTGNFPNYDAVIKILEDLKV